MGVLPLQVGGVFLTVSSVLFALPTYAVLSHTHNYMHTHIHSYIHPPTHRHQASPCTALHTVGPQSIHKGGAGHVTEGEGGTCKGQKGEVWYVMWCVVMCGV